MRKQVGNIERARKGDVVEITMSLPRKYRQLDRIFDLCVFSASSEAFEFSPHVQHIATGMTEGLEGALSRHYTPMHLVLSKNVPAAKLRFAADEDNTFMVYQTVDTVQDEEIANVRIRTYGKVGQAIKRLLGHIFGPDRGRTLGGVGV